MQIAFFDEFGHGGPYVSRSDPRYNQSPVFGLGGFVMPDRHVRNFATFFLQLKANMLCVELQKSGRHPATWEKKGADLLTRRNIERYPHLREGISRLINTISRCQGRIVFYGREKYQRPEQSHASGLYTTVLSHTIRAVDELCCANDAQFMMILDQHSDRRRLLEAAAKTMFSPENPARCLIEPPFQVESHLYQTIQAADWIATLLGRQLTYRVAPDVFPDWEWSERYFGTQLGRLITHSRLWRPASGQRALPLSSSQ